jgi:cell division protein FtsW
MAISFPARGGQRRNRPGSQRGGRPDGDAVSRSAWAGAGIRSRRRALPPEAVGLLVIVAVLSAVGLVFVLSASTVASLSVNDSLFHRFTRQAIFVMVGLVAMGIAALCPPDVFRKAAWPVFAIAVISLICVLFFGVSIDGAKRWVGPESLKFQPSELGKLAVALLGARKMSEINPRLRKHVLATVGVLAVPIFLVCLQPDLGSTSMVAIIVLAVLLAGGVPKRFLAAVSVAGIALVVLSMMVSPYQARRVTGLFADCGSEQGFHACQSLVGLGTGQATGIGVGASRAKWGYLPNADSDFIFTIIGEEVGFVGAMLVMICFVAFALLGVRIAMRASDRFSQVLALGITTWITVQALVNIAVTLKWFPVTGVPLPFISIGGTARVMTLASVGMLLSVARHGRRITSPRR